MKWDLQSAIDAASRQETQAWVEQYLQVEEWQNLGLLRRVRAYSVRWPAPQELPILSLNRIAGPGDDYKFPQDATEWHSAVARIVKSAPRLEDFPPLIAWREINGEINLADGNHRIDAYVALGFDTCWVLVHDGPLRSQEELRQTRGSRPMIDKNTH